MIVALRRHAEAEKCACPLTAEGDSPIFAAAKCILTAHVISAAKIGTVPVNGYARGIIRDRVAAGMTQKELAELAGIRVETLCRIETGKNIPSVPTVDKIDRALKEVERRKTERQHNDARKPRSKAAKKA